MRRLGAVPASMEEMETNPSQRESCRRPGGRFGNRRDGRDFVVAIPQIELHRTGAITAKRKTVQVGALTGGENQPVGCRVAHRSNRTGPIVDREGSAARGKRSEVENADGAGTEVERGTRGG